MDNIERRLRGGGRMITIPREILIGDTMYKVKLKSYYFNSNIGGNINYNDSVMGLKKSLKGKFKEDTFFHEVAHGVLKELEFNHPKITNFRNNENFVQEMGLVLRKTFKDLLKKQDDALKGVDVE